MDNIHTNRHDDRSQGDRLDQLLFETARQTTGAMDFSAAYQSICAARQKKAARRASIIRYTSLAATLVIGLGVGVLFGRQSGLQISPPPTQADTAPPPDASNDSIVSSPPESFPDNVIVDPPTEDIVVDPPKTDGSSTQEYGEDIVLTNLPATKDITQLLPKWLPDGFNNVQYELDYGYWSCFSSTVGGISADIHAGFPLSKLDDLAVGSARPLFTYYEGETEIREYAYIARLKEDVYLTVYFYSVPMDDALKVMQSIGG